MFNEKEKKNTFCPSTYGRISFLGDVYKSLRKYKNDIQLPRVDIHSLSLCVGEGSPPRASLCPVNYAATPWQAIETLFRAVKRDSWGSRSRAETVAASTHTRTGTVGSLLSLCPGIPNPPNCGLSWISDTNTSFSADKDNHGNVLGLDERFIESICVVCSLAVEYYMLLWV